MSDAEDEALRRADEHLRRALREVDDAECSLVAALIAHAQHALSELMARRSSEAGG